MQQQQREAGAASQNKSPEQLIQSEQTYKEKRLNIEYRIGPDGDIWEVFKDYQIAPGIYLASPGGS